VSGPRPIFSAWASCESLILAFNPLKVSRVDSGSQANKVNFVQGKTIAGNQSAACTYVSNQPNSVKSGERSLPFASFPYFFTAMACSSKCPPARSDPAPINSLAG
jgi:hypothetical protein